MEVCARVLKLVMVNFGEVDATWNVVGSFEGFIPPGQVTRWNTSKAHTAAIYEILTASVKGPEVFRPHLVNTANLLPPMLRSCIIVSLAGELNAMRVLTELRGHGSISACSQKPPNRLPNP